MLFAPLQGASSKVKMKTLLRFEGQNVRYGVEKVADVFPCEPGQIRKEAAVASLKTGR